MLHINNVFQEISLTRKEIKWNFSVIMYGWSIWQSFHPQSKISQSLTQPVPHWVPQLVSQTLLKVNKGYIYSFSILIHQSVDQPISHSATLLLSHSVNQSLSQSINPSICQSVTQSLSPSATQSLSQPVGLSVRQSHISLSVSESLSPSVNQPVHQSVSLWVCESFSQSVSQYCIYPCISRPFTA